MYYKLNSDYIDKCKPESLPENETYKIHWDFQIQIDDPVKSRRPDLALINKKKVDSAVSADLREKEKEGEKLSKSLDLTKEPEVLENMKLAVIPIIFGAFETVFKKLEKIQNELAIRWKIETI